MNNAWTRSSETTFVTEASTLGIPPGVRPSRSNVAPPSSDIMYACDFAQAHGSWIAFGTTRAGRTVRLVVYND